MKHKDYCCDDSTRQAYKQYYTSQAGSGLPGFQGLQYQRGHGLGSLFRGLVGVGAPLLKKVPLHWENPWDRKLSKQELNWHKITWEIIKGTATKKAHHFIESSQKRRTFQEKKEKIFTLKHASDSPAVMRVHQK